MSNTWSLGNSGSWVRINLRLTIHGQSAYIIQCSVSSVSTNIPYQQWYLEKHLCIPCVEISMQWMDGWIEGCVCVCLSVCMYVCVYMHVSTVYMYVCKYTYMYVCMYISIDGWIDEWMDGWRLYIWNRIRRNEIDKTMDGWLVSWWKHG